MPTTTPVQALPIPILGDTTNGPTAFQNLAQAAELKLVMTFASAAARTTTIPSPTAGMMSFLLDTQSLWIYANSNWVPIQGLTNTVSPPYIGTNANTPLLVRTGIVQVTTDASGNSTIPFAAAFPNSLISCTVAQLDSGGAVILKATNVSLSGVTVQARNTSFAAISTSVRISYVAYGT